MKLVLRDYQHILSTKAKELLDKHKIAYIAAQMRTGKTITSLETAKKYGAKRVLFLTKKKAIQDVWKDHAHYEKDFELSISTYQSAHKVEWDFCLIILDEVHSLISWFPKPSKTAKLIKQRWSKNPMIFLSWTPLIESASKAYPQFWVSDYSPFRQYKSFYRWFDRYGVAKKIYIWSMQVNDYSEAKYEKIMWAIWHLMLTQTQEESWFQWTITEHILEVELKPKTYEMIKKLKKDRVIVGKNDNILADTWGKLSLCFHQMFSWTIKLESGKAITIDDTKAQFIKNHFKWKKIAILTCFIQEVELLKKVLWDLFTDDLQVFNNTDKWYVGNIVANREWISLKAADALVFYNIPYSGTSFVQWRERMNHLWREWNDVYFICSKWGIEKKILKVVREKKNFTNKIFEKECL